MSLPSQLHCHTCQASNEALAHKCAQCGAPLPRVCAHCGASNRPEAHFCNQCGNALTEDTANGPGRAERRQLTVMFTEVVGATALSGAMDPEDLRDLLNHYRDICARVLRRFDGHIHQYLGNGLLVFFGYPTAHEDDAARAVRAGLGIINAIKEANEELKQRYGIPLAVRVGVHTGLVVAADIGDDPSRQTNAIVGETPNIAARVQDEAGPNTVYVSDDTFHLISGYFHAEPLGAKKLRGLSRPVNLFRVTHATGARSRLEAAGPSLSPLVGRQRELAQLRDYWADAVAGIGQGVLLEGEAGIGKSRLVRALRDHLQGSGRSFLFQCSPYHSNTPLHPVIEYLERETLAFGPDDSPQQKLEKIEGYVAQFHMPLADTVPLVASLLSVPLGEHHRMPDLTPERMRANRLALIRTLMTARSRQQPILVAVEDVHWADPTTLELIGLVMRDVPSRHVLLLVTGRPESAQSAALRETMHHLPVTRLPDLDMKQLSLFSAGQHPLDDALLATILDRADGVPLYAEELTKAAVEAAENATPGDNAPIPNSLQASLIARLDRHRNAKEVVQIGACIGRAFDIRLIGRVSDQPEMALLERLNELVNAGLLSLHGDPDAPGYVFKHALIQDAAYHSMLIAERQQTHARIARTLAEGDPQIAETQPELLAHHFTAADMPEEAVLYWLAAGWRALIQSDNMEAIARLRRGLALTSQLSDPANREKMELTLLMTLWPAVIATQGYASDEVNLIFSRADELVRNEPDAAMRGPALWALWAFHAAKSDYELARGYAAELIDLGKREANDELLVEGQWTLGGILFWQAKLSAAREHLCEALDHYDQKTLGANAYTYGQDPSIAAHCYLAFVAWYQGDIDQAMAAVDQALVTARKIKHPLSVGWALTFGAIVRCLTGDAQGTLAWAERAVDFCSKQILPFWLYISMMLKGWALAHLGRHDEAVACLQRGLDGYRGIGAIMAQSQLIAYCADALAVMGRTDEGLAMVADGLAVAQNHGESVAAGWLHKIRGDLLRQRDTDAATEAYETSLDHARAIGAKSRELETCVGYAEHLHALGETKRAYQLLKQAYEQMHEGRDTYWPKRARELIQRLGALIVEKA